MDHAELGNLLSLKIHIVHSESTLVEWGIIFLLVIIDSCCGSQHKNIIAAS